MTTIAGGLGIYADDANTTNPRVSVTTFVNKHSHSVATVDRAEFLDAVARELDVIVIPRSALPEVWVENGRAYAGREANELYSSPVDGNLNWSGNYALAVLAVHEHIKANPPVDEAQVDALAKVIRDQGEYLDESVLARRLVAAGVRAPQAGDNQ